MLVNPRKKYLFEYYISLAFSVYLIIAVNQHLSKTVNNLTELFRSSFLTASPFKILLSVCKLRKNLVPSGLNLKRESNRRPGELLRKHQCDSDFLLSWTIFRFSFV